MKTTTLALLSSAVLTWFAPLAFSQSQLDLVNGGFEVFEATAGAVPSTLANWSGDYSTIRFLPESGISPRSGLGMFQFLGARPSGAGSQTLSEMFQLVSLDPVRVPLDAGWSVIVTQTCFFNRVAGDAQTDASFSCRLDAYDGSPSTFPMRLTAGWLTNTGSGIDADSDAATWEPVQIHLVIPQTATFLAVKISAYENVFNDSVFPEYDGHFADDVSLTVGIYPPMPRLEIQLPTDGQAILSWPTVRGFAYELLHSPSLDSPDWQPFGDPYVGDDFPAFVTGPPISGASQAYFRLRVSVSRP